MGAVIRVTAPDRRGALILAGRLARLGAEVDPDGHGSTVRRDEVLEKDVPAVLAVVEQWVEEGARRGGACRDRRALLHDVALTGLRKRRVGR